MKNTILITTGLALTALTATLLAPSLRRTSTPLAGPVAASMAREEPQAAELTLATREETELSEASSQTQGGFFRLPLGRRFEHTFETEANSRMSFGEPLQVVETAMRIAGRLEALVAAVADEQLAVRVSLHSTELSIGGTGIERSQNEDRKSASELERSVHVLMASDGRTLGYRFPADMSTEVRNLFRSLWTALHCVVPAEGAKDCRIEDADASGSFQAHYAWKEEPGLHSAGVLEKTRTPLADHDDEGAGSAAHGTGRARLNLAQRWPAEMTYEETGDLAKPEMGLVAQQTTRFHFQLVAMDDVGTQELEPFDLDAAWAPVSGYAEAVLAANAESMGLAHDLAETSLGDLLEELQSLMDGELQMSRETYELLASLAELIRQDPSQLEELGELMESGALAGKAAMYALSAVGAAGTPEAQSFLARRLADGADPELQVAAVQSTLQVESPGLLLLTSLRDMAGKASIDDDIYGHSMLALGALSSRSSDSSYLDFLVAEEERTDDVASLILWLAALGNSGSPDILVKVEPYLSHDDKDVRARAVAALRDLHGSSVNGLLREACLEDESAYVRGTAIEILASRSDELSNQAVATILERETRVDVRRRAVQGLARRAGGDAFARLMLSNVFSSDPDADLRELARECLYG